MTIQDGLLFSEVRDLPTVILKSNSCMLVNISDYPSNIHLIFDVGYTKNNARYQISKGYKKYCDYWME